MALSCDFASMTQQHKAGVPLVHIEVDFKRAGKLYDEVSFDLLPKRIGNSSVHLTIDAMRGCENLFSAELVLAHMDLEKQVSSPLPETLRNAIRAELDR